jgi:hypothetical protein
MTPSLYIYRVVRMPVNQLPGYHESFKSHPLASEPNIEEYIEEMAKEGWDLHLLSVTAGSSAGADDEPKEYALLVFRQERGD